MDDPVVLLEQVFKVNSVLAQSKTFEQVPEVLRLVTNNLFKLTKQVNAKQAEHSELLHGLMLRAESTDLKLSDKAGLKDIEELVQIVGKYESASSASEEYNLDVKLTSRNTAREMLQQQGLDRIMIEEVKTIAEALIDRRIVHIQPKYEERPMIERQPDPPARFEDSMEYRQIRLQLNRLSERINEINECKVDDYDLEERVKKERIYLNSQIQKSARKSMLRVQRTDEKEKFMKVEHDLESIRYSLRKGVSKPAIADFGLISQLDELKTAIEKKADKKELAELKSKLTKDVNGKANLEDFEQIVKNFQQEIFGKAMPNTDKINQERKLQEMATQKLIRLEIVRNKEELPISASKFNEIKHTISRVEKKISNKMHNDREDYAHDAIQRVQTELEGQLKRVQTEASKQIKSLFELLQASLEEEDSKVSRFSLKKTKKSEIAPPDLAKWTSSTDIQLKQGLICWERQQVNSNTDNFLWERKKSQLMIVTPGIYEVKLAVFCQKLPMVTLLVDNQPVAFTQRQERLRGRSQHSTCMFQFLMLSGRSKLSVRVEEDVRVEALLCIRKHI